MIPAWRSAGAFYRSSSFERGALLPANLGNDADTICAIYGQLAGAMYGMSGFRNAGWNVLRCESLSNKWRISCWRSLSTSRLLLPSTAEVVTLAELGISKNLSSQAQKLAAIPSETFEAKLAAGERRRFAFIRTKETTIKDPLGAFFHALLPLRKNPVAHYADLAGGIQEEREALTVRSEMLARSVGIPLRSDRGERLCMDYREDYGLETRVLRFHNIFGWISTANASTRLIGFRRRWMRWRCGSRA